VGGGEIQDGGEIKSALYVGMDGSRPYKTSALGLGEDGLNRFQP
jgi:hypothetical protein